MPSNIVPFEFESHNIRIVMIDGEAWFVAKDVCTALGYSNARDAVDTHVDQEDRNTVAIHDGNRGNPNLTVINESGLHALIFGSRLPSAKQFKRWVTKEVLPSIRKTGGYLPQIHDQSTRATIEALIKADQAKHEAEIARKRAEEAHERLDRIETAIDQFTVVGYAKKYLNRSLIQAEASKYGRKASKLCKEMDITRGTLPHPMHGSVYTYPKSVLDLIFSH